MIFIMGQRDVDSLAIFSSSWWRHFSTSARNCATHRFQCHSSGIVWKTRSVYAVSTKMQVNLRCRPGDIITEFTGRLLSVVIADNLTMAYYHAV